MLCSSLKDATSYIEQNVGVLHFTRTLRASKILQTFSTSFQYFICVVLCRRIKMHSVIMITMVLL